MAVTFTVYRVADKGRYALLDHTHLQLSSDGSSIPDAFRCLKEGYCDEFDSLLDALVWVREETYLEKIGCIGFSIYPECPSDFVEPCNELWRISGEEN